MGILAGLGSRASGGSPSGSRRWGPVLAAAGAMILGAWTAPPDQEKRSAEEYEVKAAFLVHFAKFVEWPAEARPAAGASLRIGIAGKDPSGGVFEKTLSGKSAQGSPLTVEFFDDLDKAGQYHMIFIPGGARDLEERLLKAVAGKPVLTVGEHEEFIHAGGLFNFFLEDKKVRLELSNDAATKVGLSVSSKLLRVARLVK